MPYDFYVKPILNESKGTFHALVVAVWRQIDKELPEFSILKWPQTLLEGAKYKTGEVYYVDDDPDVDVETQVMREWVFFPEKPNESLTADPKLKNDWEAYLDKIFRNPTTSFGVNLIARHVLFYPLPPNVREDDVLDHVFEASRKELTIEADRTGWSNCGELFSAFVGAGLALHVCWDGGSGKDLYNRVKNYNDPSTNESKIYMEMPPDKPESMEVVVEQQPTGFQLMGPKQTQKEQLTLRVYQYIEDVLMGRDDLLLDDKFESWSFHEELEIYAHIGQRFRWELELLDKVGQVISRATEVARRYLCVPPPDANVTITQNIEPSLKYSLGLAIDVPRDIKEDAAALRVELWCRPLPMAPLGFYGDANDIAALDGLRAMDLDFDPPKSSMEDPDELNQYIRDMFALSPERPDIDPLLHTLTKLGEQGFENSDAKFPFDDPMEAGRSYEFYCRTVRLGDGHRLFTYSELTRCTLVLNHHPDDPVKIPFLENIHAVSFEEPVRVWDRLEACYGKDDQTDEQTGHDVWLRWQHKPNQLIGGYRVSVRDGVSPGDGIDWQVDGVVQVLYPRVFALQRPTLEGSRWEDPGTEKILFPASGTEAPSTDIDIRVSLLNSLKAHEKIKGSYRLVLSGQHSSLSDEHARQVLRSLKDLIDLSPGERPARLVSILESLGYASRWRPLAPLLNDLVESYTEIRERLDPEETDNFRNWVIGATNALAEKRVMVVWFKDQRGFVLAEKIVVAIPTKEELKKLVEANSSFKSEWDKGVDALPDEGTQFDPYPCLVQTFEMTVPLLPSNKNTTPSGETKTPTGEDVAPSAPYEGMWASWRYDKLRQDKWAHHLQVHVEPLSRYALFDLETFDHQEATRQLVKKTQGVHRVKVPRVEALTSAPFITAEPTPNRTGIRFRITETSEMRAAHISALHRLRLGDPQFEHDISAVKWLDQARYVSFLDQLEGAGLYPDKDKEKFYQNSFTKENGSTKENGFTKDRFYQRVAPTDTLLVTTPGELSRQQEDSTPQAAANTRRVDHLHHPYWLEAIHRVRVRTHGVEGAWQQASARCLPSVLGLPKKPVVSYDVHTHELIITIWLARLQDHLEEEVLQAMCDPAGAEPKVALAVEAFAPEDKPYKAMYLGALPDMAMRYEIGFSPTEDTPSFQQVFGIAAPLARASEGEMWVPGQFGFEVGENLWRHWFRKSWCDTPEPKFSFKEGLMQLECKAKVKLQVRKQVVAGAFYVSLKRGLRTFGPPEKLDLDKRL